jgi:hypothetical protein
MWTMPALSLLALTGLTMAIQSPARATRASDSQATLTLGARASVGPVSVRPLSVEQDSRCAADAQCIWAGTVQVKAWIATPRRRQMMMLTLAEPVEVVRGRWITLAAVCPAPRLGQPIAAAAYRLTFRFDRTRPVREAQAPC